MFFIIENKSKQLSSLPNDVKLRIHSIDQLEKYFLCKKTQQFSSIENTMKKSHIQSNLHLIYRKTSIMMNNMKSMNMMIYNISPY